MNRLIYSFFFLSSFHNHNWRIQTTHFAEQHDSTLFVAETYHFLWRLRTGPGCRNEFTKLCVASRIEEDDSSRCSTRCGANGLRQHGCCGVWRCSRVGVALRALLPNNARAHTRCVSFACGCIRACASVDADDMLQRVLLIAQILDR